MKIIHSNNAPAALGPYSQAVEVNNQLYVSGVLGIDPTTGNLKGSTIQEQTKQICQNIAAILKEANYAKETVVKCNVFLTNLNDFAEFNKIYGEFFGNHKPARSCVQISKIVKNALIEIDVTCCK